MTEGVRKAWTVAKIVFLRLRFIFVFIVVGVIVGNWDWILNVVDKFTRPRGVEEAGAGEFEWFCPMHPTVIRQDPKEKCPICGMPLSRRKRGEKTQLPPGVLSRLQLSPFRIRQAGVATEEVRYRILVREIRTVGFIEADERKLSQIAARTAGRVDRLFVDFAGTTVKKDEPLVWLYSPDLVATQEEYLLALRTLDKIKAEGQLDEGAVARARDLAHSARERLRLWGLTEEQLRQLESSRKAETHLKLLSPIDGTVLSKYVLSGQYVQEGTELYLVADLSAVWMQAEFFERDVGLVKVGQTVEITTEAYPGESFLGVVSFVAPTLQTDTRTVKARVDVRNPEGKIKPGMYVTAVLRAPLGQWEELFYGCCESCPEVRSDLPGECPKCQMALVKQGGVRVAEVASLGRDLRELQDFVYQCPHDGAVIDKPGPCPKCQMPLGESHKVPKGTLVSKERSIYVCEAHPEKVSDKPGQCFKDT